MSVIRPRPPEDPLSHEAVGPAGRPWLENLPVAPLAAGIGDRLETIRSQMVAAPVALDLPRRLLDEYGERRPSSRLFAVLAEARRIREACDRLVIAAGGSLGPATQLFAAACCHPFHDQLSRGDRGSRPRLAWVDGQTDNDRLQGLFDLIAPPGRPRPCDLLDRWALLAIDPAADPAADPTLLAAVELLVERLVAQQEGGAAAAAEWFVAIASPGSRLAALAGAHRGARSLAAEPEIETPAGAFSAACLLPAAIAGIDVVQLLKGATAMLVRFSEAPAAGNPVFADAVCLHVARGAGRAGRVFAGSGLPLAELSAWEQWLRPAPVGSQAVVTRLVIEGPRRDRLPLPAAVSEAVSDAVSETAGPAIEIRLPRLDEHSLGQLMQLLILSAAVERELERPV
jgi:glucose-6-phosphate isomerase